MKELKVCAIALIVVIMFLVSCAYCIACAEAGDYELYPRLTIVYDREYVNNTWKVYCIDKYHNHWIFFDDEGTWEQGDIANLLMLFTTPDREDHEIIDVYWEGYMENLNDFFQMTNWR